MNDQSKSDRDATRLYANKALAYSQYRPDYSDEAIAVFQQATMLPAQSVILDVGSGTGMLSRHLLRHFNIVYGLEPTKEMREVAEGRLANQSGFQSLTGRAEAVPLPDQCVDVITVGQAIHWFQPERTLSEFQRVAKYKAWLLLAHIKSLDDDLNLAMQSLFTEKNGLLPPSEHPPSNLVPESFYFHDGVFRKERFEYNRPEPWETFLGGVATAAYAPDQGHPLYEKFCQTAREIFKRFSQEGILTWKIATVISFGYLNRERTG